MTLQSKDDAPNFQVLSVSPRDIMVTFAISLTNVNKLLDILNICAIELDKVPADRIEYMTAARDFMIDDFFRVLDSISEKYSETKHGS